MPSETEIIRLIRSIKGILDEIPLDAPVIPDRVFIDPSKLEKVPQYLKSNFKIMFRYKLGTPYDAACLIYSPKDTVTVVVIINKKYEMLFHTFLKNFPTDKDLQEICTRRSIYVHEICHLIAAIALFPNNYDTATRQIFRQKVSAKFGQEINEADGRQFFAHFEKTVPPFIFSNDHFRYTGDEYNYYELYQEIMISDDQISEAVNKMFEPKMVDKLRGFPLNKWIAIITYIDPEFFDVFIDKKEVFLTEIPKHFPAKRNL
jgi:hypothetical protein